MYGFKTKNIDHTRYICFYTGVAVFETILS